MSSRYKPVFTQVWGDERFRALSAAPPNAQTLWLYLLTGPHLQCTPGITAEPLEAIAARLGWPLDATLTCFAELEAVGMAQVDRATHVLVVPRAPEYDPPRSVNTIVAWARELDALPECPLREEHRRRLLSVVPEGRDGALRRLAHERLGRRGRRGTGVEAQLPLTSATSKSLTSGLTKGSSTDPSKGTIESPIDTAQPGAAIEQTPLPLSSATSTPLISGLANPLTRPSPFPDPDPDPDPPCGVTRARIDQRWAPPDPRGRENGWPWRTDMPEDRFEPIARLEFPALSWAVRIQWYWPDLDPNDAGEIAVQTLRLYHDKGVDVRGELAKAAGARPRRDGTLGLRRFLAAWMGRAQVDVARAARGGAPPPTGPSRPLPPPAAEVCPPAPERTPDEEAETAAAREACLAAFRGAAADERTDPLPLSARGLPASSLSQAQRAQLEEMGARARDRAQFLSDGTAGAVAAGQLADVIVGKGEV